MSARSIGATVTQVETALEVLANLSEHRVDDGALRDSIARVRSELHDLIDP